MRKERGKDKAKKKNSRGKKVIEEWEIWDEEERTAKLEIEVKKLVPERFHRWIKVFSKKQSERMLTQKI